MKSPNESPEFDRERETRVLLEDMNHNIKLIAEGHIGLNDKLDGLIGRFDNMEEKVNLIPVIYNALLEQRGVINELKTDVKIVKADVAQLKSDVAELKTDVAELKTDMKIVKSDVAEIKVTIKGHDQRFTKLEAATK